MAKCSTPEQCLPLLVPQRIWLPGHPHVCLKAFHTLNAKKEMPWRSISGTQTLIGSTNTCIISVSAAPAAVPLDLGNWELTSQLKRLAQGQFIPTLKRLYLLTTWGLSRGPPRGAGVHLSPQSPATALWRPARRVHKSNKDVQPRLFKKKKKRNTGQQTKNRQTTYRER